MTEADWVTCTQPGAMLGFIRRHTLNDRKHQLFAVACCRRVWHLLYDGRSRRGVEAAEWHADGDRDYRRLEQSRDEAVKAVFHAAVDGTEDHDDTWQSAAQAAASVANYSHSQTQVALAAALHAAGARSPQQAAESAVQAGLMRCIFGNPFRPITFASEWLTDTAVTLAAQMYESRDFSAMPILADALQDASCDNPDILNHCRDTNQVHVRGCWVVDLVLGKS